MKSVLQLTPLPVPPGYRAPLDFPVELLLEGAEGQEWLAEHGSAVRVVVTHSLRGIPSGLWAQLPSLQLVANFGAGLDLIDLNYARARGIQVTYTPDLLTHDVADLAIALMLNSLRRIVEANTYVRDGAWGKRPFGAGRSTKNRRLGILGLGRIGNAIAQRASAFGIQIGYHSRSRIESPYAYYPTPAALAAWADVLIAAVPGGDETHHMVNANILSELGSEGIFINIARGPVVDTSALIDALERGVIAGAGLDVFEGQPIDGASYKGLPNVVLTPHIGSLTTDTRIEMADSVYRNVGALLSGQPLQDLASAR